MTDPEEIAPEMLSIFDSKSRNYETNRTRKSIEVIMQNQLMKMHALRFRSIGSGQLVLITEQTSPTITTFIFDVPKRDDYDRWNVQIQINRFVSHYDEWFAGGNNEWLKHFKPFSR